jgi:hypothetical protein
LRFFYYIGVVVLQVGIMSLWLDLVDKWTHDRFKLHVCLQLLIQYSSLLNITVLLSNSSLVAFLSLQNPNLSQNYSSLCHLTPTNSDEDGAKGRIYHETMKPSQAYRKHPTHLKNYYGYHSGLHISSTLSLFNDAFKIPVHFLRERTRFNHMTYILIKPRACEYQTKQFVAR